MRLYFATVFFSTLVLASSCGKRFWSDYFPRQSHSPFVPRPNYQWLNVKPSFTQQRPHNFQKLEAEVDLVSASGSSVTGKIFLQQIIPGKIVQVEGKLAGLKPGLHGFHVHEKGELGNDCKDAGPHFNPFGQNHGAPFAFTRHVGDLGNVKTSSKGDGSTRFTIQDSLISLEDGVENSILGLAIVVHDGEDDLGFGGNEESLKTGNAGTRVACGVIRRLHVRH